MSGRQYVFAQFLNLLPRYDFQRIVNKYNGDYRTKHFKCWNQMACMIFADIRQEATQIALLQYREGLTDYTRVLNTQQLLVTQQDSLASSRGDIVRYLITVYKSLGGGWQSRAGKDFVPEKTIEAMGKRTDWGDLLMPISLPDRMEQPPTGKEVKVFNKPQW